MVLFETGAAMVFRGEVGSVGPFRYHFNELYEDPYSLGDIREAGKNEMVWVWCRTWECEVNLRLSNGFQYRIGKNRKEIYSFRTLGTVSVALRISSYVDSTRFSLYSLICYRPDAGW